MKRSKPLILNLFLGHFSILELIIMNQRVAHGQKSTDEESKVENALMIANPASSPALHNESGLRKEVISQLHSVDAMVGLLSQNPGIVVLKFGSEWCRPCKQIKHLVEGFFASSPPNVICADLDVDENAMLYSYLKRRRVVNGIPVLLMYKLGNKSIMPTDSVTGGNPHDLDRFFRRCGQHMTSLSQAFGRTNRLPSGL